jgi:phenylalanyl-tRNA synthetase beta chain
MLVPISWLKEFVEINISLEELAHKLTMAGLEVEEIRYVGLPIPEEVQAKFSSEHAYKKVTRITGLSWDPENIVVGEILEVFSHPNADRLVLCRLNDGIVEHTVLTGAPNLFQYKDTGPLETTLRVAYAKEGAKIYDGHQPGQQVMTLKRTKIRGIESYSMACSEKELGISEDHEGIIILDQDAPVGMPLRDYMGDAVYDIKINPNMARNTSILGVAREIAAITITKLRELNFEFHADGPSIQDKASIEIKEPELNPRFVLGLIEGIEIAPSPYWVQRRLRLAGMRPINNIVDATNYTMLEVGEPLHAFDYDVLVERASGKAPTIITRTADPGEKLVTLDGVERELDDFIVLVCDTAGPLSIAGVMGGLESEVSENTRNVLLEGAAWNFINIRKTLISQRMESEAAYRFSRGIHPSLAQRGVNRCLEYMRQWTHGAIYQGLVDNYPLPPDDPLVTITPADVNRWLGIELSPQEIAELLERLEFTVSIEGMNIHARTPDHRLDIGEGITGMADLMEEVARIYGYERIPETRLADELPPQHSNPVLERGERIRDALVSLGLQEIMSHRLTNVEKEARRLPVGVHVQTRSYLRITNPVSSERDVLRQSLLASVLDVVERNARIRERLTLFETGPIYLSKEDDDLPDEPQHLVVILTGPRELMSWQGADIEPMNFYDLKGILSALFEGLHIENITYAPELHPSFHPGKCARVILDDQDIGVFGELHPLLHENYEFNEAPIQAADLDLDAIMHAIPERYEMKPVPPFPPVLEDLAIVVDDNLPAMRVEDVLREAGAPIVTHIRLFDVYHGMQVGEGKKSLAYSLTYQAADRTLTDEEVAKIRGRIVKKLEDELNAYLRS